MINIIYKNSHVHLKCSTTGPSLTTDRMETDVSARRSGTSKFEKPIFWKCASASKFNNNFGWIIVWYSLFLDNCMAFLSVSLAVSVSLYVCLSLPLSVLKQWHSCIHLIFICICLLLYIFNIRRKKVSVPKSSWSSETSNCYVTSLGHVANCPIVVWKNDLSYFIGLSYHIYLVCLFIILFKMLLNLFFKINSCDIFLLYILEYMYFFH